MRPLIAATVAACAVGEHRRLPVHSEVELPWPSVIDDFTNGDRKGILQRVDAQELDFRHYYRFVALELLLVHHGFLDCQASAAGSPARVDKVIPAVEDFQRNRGLAVNAFELSQDFWTQLVVPLQPGADNPAVMALWWLMRAAAGPSRNPLLEQSSGDCSAPFDGELEAVLLDEWGLTDDVYSKFGLPEEVWRQQLLWPEARPWAGCGNRALVAQSFGVAWVVIWSMMAIAFVVFHDENFNHKKASKEAMEAFQNQPLARRVLTHGREAAVLLAVTVCHNLGTLGVWTLPHDLLSQVLAGCQLAAGTTAVLRLAGWSRSLSLRPAARLLLMGSLMAVTAGLYCLLGLIDHEHVPWMVAAMVMVTVVWTCALTPAVTGHRRVDRTALVLCVLLFAMALPTALLFLSGAVSGDGGQGMLRKEALWPLTLTPLYLFLLSALVEGPGGRLVDRCEYTAETQWLLAAILRLSVELARFMSALAVFLLSLVLEGYGLEYLLVHLAMTLVAEVLLRAPCHLPPSRGSVSFGGAVAAPFTAGEIVLHADADPWAYRYRAPMLSIEVVLFLAHLCQLLFIGIPVGVESHMWWAGLGLIAVCVLLRQGVVLLLAKPWGARVPQVPWFQLPGHLLSLMLGTGLVMSTYLQVSLLWLLYGHHWVACFVTGTRHAGVEVAADWEYGTAILMALVGFLLLGLHLVAFYSWAEWTLKLRAEGDDLILSKASEHLASQNYRWSWPALSPRSPSAAGQSPDRPALRQAATSSSEISADPRSARTAAIVTRVAMGLRLERQRSQASSENESDGDGVDSESGGRASLTRALSMKQAWTATLKDLYASDNSSLSEAASREPTKEGPAAEAGEVLPPGFIVQAEAQPLLGSAPAAPSAPEQTPGGKSLDADQTLNLLLQSLESTQAAATEQDAEGESQEMRLERDNTSALFKDLLEELPSATGQEASEADDKDRLREAGAATDADQALPKLDSGMWDTDQDVRDVLKTLEDPKTDVEAATTGDVDRLLRASLSKERVSDVLDKLDAASPVDDEKTTSQLTEEQLAEQRQKEQEEAAQAAENERLAREAAEREAAEREAAERERLAQEEAERQRAAEEAAAAAERERLAREEAQREAEERERLQREAEERARLQREAEEREAARREAARQVLMSAMQARSRGDIEQCLQRVQEDALPPELVSDAEGVLQELAREETRAAAERAMQEACFGSSVHDLRQAIKVAREAGAHEELVARASERLEKLEAEIVRREVAAKWLRDSLGQVGDHHSTASPEALSELITKIQEALQEAQAAAVPESQLEPARQTLSRLGSWRDRSQALRDMGDRLKEQDVSGTKEALKRAKEVGVDASEVMRVEKALAVLIDEIELANNKVKLLTRRIEKAVKAKAEAESAQKSRDIELLIGDGSAISALRAAIEDARKTRMVKKSDIAKADAVAAEVTADLKRILAEKQQEEKWVATEQLRGEMEVACKTELLSEVVLKQLRTAITAAEEFKVDTRDAEALLAQLTAEHDEMLRSAQEGLDRALNSRDVQEIKACMERCRELRMQSSVATAMVQIRDIFSEDAAAAREFQKEQRLAAVAKLSTLVGVLRSHGDQKLRALHNELQDLKGALRVFCRVRPLNGREVKKGDSIAVDSSDSFTVSLQSQKDQKERLTFNYDAIFGPTSSQAEVFSECKSMVQSAIDGYNVTIFTYGQTGAGKTWTLYGSGTEPGISPRLCEEVFRFVNRDKDKFSFILKAQMIELYLNDLRDLLQSKGVQQKLELHSQRQPDGSTKVHLEGATQTEVKSADDLAKVVATGLGNRKVRATQMNADSSRSHLMLVINLEVTDKTSGRSRAGKITLVDLAGSERLSKSGATGEGAKEAIEINKSLTALGDVMMAFTSKAKMIPYRNHKLTQLMQDSLGGTAKTLMFVNVSPSSSNVEETINSLKYASRARCIENDVHPQTRRASAAPGHK